MSSAYLREKLIKFLCSLASHLLCLYIFLLCFSCSKVFSKLYKLERKLHWPVFTLTSMLEITLEIKFHLSVE